MRIPFGGVGISVLVILAPLSGANAADMSVKAPPAPVPYVATWTGAYLGMSAGGAWGDGNFTHGFNDAIFGALGAPITGTVSGSGVIIGVTDGYNLQLNRFLIGYESDTSVTTLKGRGGNIPPFNSAFTNGYDEHLLSTFRGRVGVVCGDWLFYGTGGAALADVEQNVSFVGGGGGAISQQHWIWGWTAGGGIEWMPISKLSFKLEYLHVDLQTKSYFNPASLFAGVPTFLNDQQLKLTEDIVRVGAAYHFDIPWSILTR